MFTRVAPTQRNRSGKASDGRSDSVRLKHIDIVEVGPRDGFQPIATMIPTEHKMRMIEALYRAGVRRMEATAFVSPLAVPQLADAPDILTFAQSLPGLDVQILVPTLRSEEPPSDLQTLM